MIGVIRANEEARSRGQKVGHRAPVTDQWCFRKCHRCKILVCGVREMKSPTEPHGENSHRRMQRESSIDETLCLGRQSASELFPEKLRIDLLKRKEP